MHQNGLAMNGFASNCEIWPRNDAGLAIAVSG